MARVSTLTPATSISSPYWVRSITTIAMLFVRNPERRRACLAAGECALPDQGSLIDA
jgi:hypothetical protein